MTTRTTKKAAAAPAKSGEGDLDVIYPDEIRVTLDGIECKVKRLKTREFLALLKVLTAGLGEHIGMVQLDFSDGDAVARDMSALMVLALPNAVEEFAVFLGTIVEPVDPEKNTAVMRYVHDNPDLDEMLSIFEAVAVQEKDDLAALAGKAQAMWSRIGALYGARKPTTS